MNKEQITQNQNQKEDFGTPEKVLFAFTSAALTVALIGAYIENRLGNNLTAAKKFMSDPQAQENSCGNGTAGCNLIQTTKCDGNNTWTKSDDVCEEIDYLQPVYTGGRF
ncbi:MAG: hypothetical protein WCL07_04900 [bacterium]